MSPTFRKSVRTCAATVAVCALALTSACAEPPEEIPQDYTQIDPDAGPPLPPGSEFEVGHQYTPNQSDTYQFNGSLAPDDRTPEERIPDVVERGRIIVGVDQSQYLLSFRNPVSGELEGFEIDLAREIAQDIFGDPDAVEFRFVDSIDRVRALEQGMVDIVIRSISITTERAAQVELSTPYFRTQTRLLSMVNSDIESVGDLTGQTVCVTESSTALNQARELAPNSRLLKTRNWADCLVALQQQQAQAVISDDSILSGIAAQDPYTRILPASLHSEAYGIAMPRSLGARDTSGLVRQVNSTLERIFDDGRWWEMHQQWFGPYLYASGPPPLNYREEPENEPDTEEDDS